MTIKTVTLGAGAALCLSINPAFAEDAPAKRDWKASAELGYLQTDGNSDSETLKAKFKGSKSYANWKHSLVLKALNSSQNDTRSSEKYVAGFQSDYAIDDKSYALAALSWEKDRFSGYDYQASVVLGYGYHVIQSADKMLSFELAPGFRVSELNPGEKQEDAIVRVSEKFEMALSESSSLDQTLSHEYGDSNSVTRFDIAISSQVANDLSMKVGYGLTRNSDVAQGAEKTDKETSVTLVYSF